MHENAGESTFFVSLYPARRIPARGPDHHRVPQWRPSENTRKTNDFSKAPGGIPGRPSSPFGALNFAVLRKYMKIQGNQRFQFIVKAPPVFGRQLHGIPMQNAWFLEGDTHPTWTLDGPRMHSIPTVSAHLAQITDFVVFPIGFWHLANPLLPPDLPPPALILKTGWRPNSAENLAPLTTANTFNLINIVNIILGRVNYFNKGFGTPVLLGNLHGSRAFLLNTIPSIEL